MLGSSGNTFALGLHCRCCGKTAGPTLFRPGAPIQMGTHFGSTIKAKPSGNREPAPRHFTPYHGKTTLSLRSKTPEMAASPGVITTMAKLLGKSAALTLNLLCRSLAERRTHKPQDSAGRCRRHCQR